MDPNVVLILKLVIEVVGTASELGKLAQRVLAGEEIKQEEIDAVRADINGALTGWDAIKAKRLADDS